MERESQLCPAMEPKRQCGSILIFAAMQNWCARLGLNAMLRLCCDWDLSDCSSYQWRLVMCVLFDHRKNTLDWTRHTSQKKQTNLEKTKPRPSNQIVLFFRSALTIANGCLSSLLAILMCLKSCFLLRVNATVTKCCSRLHRLYELQYSCASAESWSCVWCSNGLIGFSVGLRIFPWLLTAESLQSPHWVLNKQGRIAVAVDVTTT